MKTKTKRTACRYIALLSVLYALGCVGGMDAGLSLNAGVWNISAALAVLIVASWKGGMWK